MKKIIKSFVGLGLLESFDKLSGIHLPFVACCISYNVTIYCIIIINNNSIYLLWRLFNK
jgi:hypothetical protein